MADLWRRHHLADRPNTAPYYLDDEVLFDPSTRQYGETKLSESELVQAIDCRAKASRIATVQHVSLEEAVSMLAAD